MEQEKITIKRNNEAKKNHDEVILEDSDDDTDWIQPQEQDSDDTEIFITEKDLENPLLHLPKEGEYFIVELTTKKTEDTFVHWESN